MQSVLPRRFAALWGTHHGLAGPWGNGSSPGLCRLDGGVQPGLMPLPVTVGIVLW